MGRWWIAAAAALLAVLAGIGVAGRPSSVPNDVLVRLPPSTTVPSTTG